MFLGVGIGAIIRRGHGNCARPPGVTKAEPGSYLGEGTAVLRTVWEGPTPSLVLPWLPKGDFVVMGDVHGPEDC